MANKTDITKTIEVKYDAGAGALVARCDEDHTLSSNVTQWGGPIDANTDSWDVACAVTEINGAEIISVDHDGDTVSVHVDGATCD